MKSDAYWINPNGKIFPVDIRHINNILENPDKFGLSQFFIKKIYKKYPKEKIGQEGNAREEIMIEVMRLGWIRIRKHKNLWIIQCYNLNRKNKDSIWDFIKYLISNKYEGKYADVMITALNPEYVANMNFEDVIRGKLYESNEYLANKNKILETISKINNKDIKLKTLIKEKRNKVITEIKLGKIWKYISDENSVFGIISAFRAENSKEENEKLSSELLKKIRNKYGYIMLKGGFVESGTEVIEDSLLIPKISRDEIIKLGIDYNQYSIIHKDRESFAEISTNDESGIGKILNKFSIDERDNLIFTKELLKNYFSSLMYGPHAGRKFLFKLQERESASLNRIAYNKIPLRWNTFLEEK
jgi:gamma-glutamylcyclotransferase (GGCT)/AIG2-like uncharacterized protein YtfP